MECNSNTTSVSPHLPMLHSLSSLMLLLSLKIISGKMRESEVGSNLSGSRVEDDKAWMLRIPSPPSLSYHYPPPSKITGVKEREREKVCICMFVRACMCVCVSCVCVFVACVCV